MRHDYTSREESSPGHSRAASPSSSEVSFESATTTSEAQWIPPIIIQQHPPAKTTTTSTATSDGSHIAATQQSSSSMPRKTNPLDPLMRTYPAPATQLDIQELLEREPQPGSLRYWQQNVKKEAAARRIAASPISVPSAGNEDEERTRKREQRLAELRALRDEVASLRMPRGR